MFAKTKATTHVASVGCHYFWPELIALPKNAKAKNGKEEM
jgi:hypothetical protein